jgi:hypothetical protein
LGQPYFFVCSRPPTDTGRETFTGIVLSEAEAADALDRLAHAFAEAASHGAGWLLRQGKKDEKGEKDKKDEGDV